MRLALREASLFRLELENAGLLPPLDILSSEFDPYLSTVSFRAKDERTQNIQLNI